MKMRETKDIRLHNARLLQQSVGGQKGMIEKTGRSQSQLSALMGDRAYKPIGHKIARALEADFELPNGWMDVWHETLNDDGNTTGISEPLAGYSSLSLEEILSDKGDDVQLLRGVLQKVHEICQEEDINLNSEQFARVVVACLYSSLRQGVSGQIDSPSIVTAIHAVS